MNLKKYVPVFTMDQVINSTEEELKEATEQAKPPGYNMPPYFFAQTKEGTLEFSRSIPVIAIPRLPDET